MSNSTIDRNDINRFEALSKEWWEPSGSMKSLHQFTPIRIEYFKKAIKRHQLGDWENEKPLSNLQILDIGCGGGLLAEPMARLGGDVTGIDGSSSAIETARLHAKSSELNINYSVISAEELADTDINFDIIYASEVIEHVANRSLFLSAIERLLAPNGIVILTTINRTFAALALAKFAAENILKIVPKGAHEFDKFVKPAELQAEARKAGIILDDFTGFMPLLDGRFKFTSITAINYAASGSRIK
ncbi:bifunctional 2-polyprenyl-6-hydroxyphenol methylase/3-demethylubiquinol 3-O-methyltransferase UbiG [Alphaproteobacteria bacterium]|jgi:2-polyprenyl-6-hydroxyphenyl methylase / 3-demethylubiquinone-9 3-methyltransferase|nr:bifunctional 2-polyprenyl-6-hydroxyphenol methylase/3-demethylubiquinol 3-O-methyltransferase UbiG [Alphaproteobacteria bacterium]MBT5798593.1 bifunctional 2-polyprenyl-6-hydroxyphenol methylase/3-demethylubiquinol 3-O-methyltransferase UbiG [Alphaproteobacteria bacterium]MDC0394299.1 bifunctional 2-polyprenyl-6-hydroxyphenol methylase/3-demethylubiquinol 3-O-methyltransferase UbiG [Alphaproteobacteria bacterium]MDC0461820.1 bifunctional 2-polyprenyl-6-hydroxyphenol methylase/3-demethylubiqui